MNPKTNLIIDTVIKAVVIIVLIIAAATNQEYSYYTFTRWLVMSTSVYFAYKTLINKQTGLLIFYICTILIFNPFFKVWFQKETWHLIDYLLAAVLLIIIIFEWKSRKSYKMKTNIFKPEPLSTKSKIIISKEIIINLKLLLISIIISFIFSVVLYFNLNPKNIEINDRMKIEQSLSDIDDYCLYNVIEYTLSIPLFNISSSFIDKVFLKFRLEHNDFKLTKDEFNIKMQNRNYQLKVYDALKEIDKSFDLTKKDFLYIIDNEEKNNTNKFNLKKINRAQLYDIIKEIDPEFISKSDFFRNIDNDTSVEMGYTHDLYDDLSQFGATLPSYNNFMLNIGQTQKYQLTKKRVYNELLLNLIKNNPNKYDDKKYINNEIRFFDSSEFYKLRMKNFYFDILFKSLSIFIILLIILITSRYSYKIFKKIILYSKMDLNEK